MSGATQDWRTLPAGRALDAIVAERVLDAFISEGSHDVYMTLPGERPVSDQRPVPTYSADIAAAWLVVEELRAGGWMLALEDWDGTEWTAVFEHAARGALQRVAADTAPLAIVRAALAAEVPA